MSRKTVTGITLATLALTASAAVPADAAITGTFPDTLESRTFGTTNGGWTSMVDYGGLVCIPGVTCPTANPSFLSTGGAQGVGDGHVRNTFGSLLGVLSTNTIAWTSPSFVSPAADGATLTFDVRPQIASLLAIGSVKIETFLVDVADGTKTSMLSTAPLTAASASFGKKQIDVPAGKLVAGRTYQVRVATSFTNNVSAVTSGNVDIDNIVFEAFTLNSPSGLTGAFPASGVPRIAGSVDPTLGTADVKVEYGPTAAYGSTTAPVTVTGSGAQPYSIPLTGLTPGATYHYRVVATNTDGSTATSDATFVAPSAPAATAPQVTGSAKSRNRTVTFTRGADTASAKVEVIGTDGTSVIDTVDDTGDDGEVAIVLPDADGAYGVRVVRTSPESFSSTSTHTAVVLDRVAPSTAALGVSVTPEVAQGTSRTVLFTRPGDAQTVVAQVVDAGGNDVGAPVTAVGGSASVTLGSADGAYRVKLTLTDAAGNSTTVTSDPVSVDKTGPSTAALGLSVTPAAAQGTSRTVLFTRPGDAQTVVAQVVDAGGNDVGAPVTAVGGSVGVTLGSADGAYHVKLTLTDAYGNSTSAMSAAVRVDTAAPAKPTVTTAPAARTRLRAVTVPFTIEPDATAECRLDGGQWVPCSSPFTAYELQDGDHALELRQTDAAGNLGPVETVAWKVDTSTPAAPVIGSGPKDGTTDTGATFVFTGEAGGTFEYALDGGAWAPATSPLTLRDLTVGAHTVRLRQTNAIGTPGAVREIAWTIAAVPAAPPAATPAAETPAAKPAATPVAAPKSTPAPRTSTATTPAARVFTATVNDERTSGSPSTAPTVAVEKQAVDVGCRTAGVDLDACSVNLYATIGADGRAIAAASRRVLVGTGNTEARGASRRLAVRVTLNPTGRRLLASAPGGLKVAVSITGTPTEGKPIKTMSNAKLVARRMTVVVGGFATNGATPPAAARRQLDALARSLASGATVRVTGHTDSSTTDKAFLEELGLRRAQAVRRYLAAHGAKATWTVGTRGDRAPRTSNGTLAGREANRRVVLRITL